MKTRRGLLEIELHGGGRVLLGLVQIATGPGDEAEIAQGRGNSAQEERQQVLTPGGQKLGRGQGDE